MSAGAETIWLDVRVRRWASWWTFRWLWRQMGHVPRWAIRIRKADPPSKGPPMKRLKVIIARDPLMERCSARAMSGLPARLVDADTGQALDCVQDFSINIPMDGAITVDARLLVADIEVRPGLSADEPAERE